MKDYQINIFWSDEDEGYIADIPDLDSCSAFGLSPAVALSEVERTKALWLEAARAEGRPIPEPRYRPHVGSMAEGPASLGEPRIVHAPHLLVPYGDVVVAVLP